MVTRRDFLQTGSVAATGLLFTRLAVASERLAEGGVPRLGLFFDESDLSGLQALYSSDPMFTALREALAWKNAFARRSDARFYIATQFCFEAAPVIAWDKAIRVEGNGLPIHIGVPGLATLKTLINHAKACGIGPSMRFLTRQARNVAKLMTVNAPDRFLLDLARYKASDPDCGIAKAHIYPLGGLRRSAKWSYAVVDGAFEIKRDAKGFTVTREVD